MPDQIPPPSSADLKAMFDDAYLKPMIERTLDILRRRGLLPSEPVQEIATITRNVARES